MFASERSVDRALELAERRFGLGSGLAAPGWVRDRVRAVLQTMATREGIATGAVVDRMRDDPREMDELIVALRVGETRFYRDRALWETLARDVIPSLPQRPIVALSAGCSTGEEAFTLAMLLTTARRRFRVVAVDRSAEAIETAREGVYATEAARDLPAAWATRFCETKGASLVVSASLRASVELSALDLVQRAPPGPFDLILFRNVLLYLAPRVGEGVATKLASSLSPSGVLFAATSEVPRLRAAGLAPVRFESGITGFYGPSTAPRPSLFPPPPRPRSVSLAPPAHREDHAPPSSSRGGAR